jgi:hypothetical protein
VIRPVQWPATDSVDDWLTVVALSASQSPVGQGVKPHPLVLATGKLLSLSRSWLDDDVGDVGDVGVSRELGGTPLEQVRAVRVGS